MGFDPTHEAELAQAAAKVAQAAPACPDWLLALLLPRSREMGTELDLVRMISGDGLATEIRMKTSRGTATHLAFDADTWKAGAVWLGLASELELVEAENVAIMEDAGFERWAGDDERTEWRREDMVVTVTRAGGGHRATVVRGPQEDGSHDLVAALVVEEFTPEHLREWLGLQNP